MTPVIAIVGRPNVGKSTLFNYLTKTKDALVSDFFGLTRDRKYGKAKFSGKKFIIIDTGGVNDFKNGIESHIFFQTLLAIQEADIIFFMIDVCFELKPIDHEIAKHLCSDKKNIYLLINKVDSSDTNIINNFYKLGIRNIFLISALYGYGISKLIKKVITNYFLESLNINKIELKNKINSVYWDTKKNKSTIKNNKNNDFYSGPTFIKLAIVGKPNVGKSTLTNCILGRKRVVVYELPGTTRDSIYIPMELHGHRYILIDTAGVRKKRKIAKDIEKCSVIKTLQSIKEANIVLLIIDAEQGISNQDLSLLNFILNTGRSLIVVVNKWDNIKQQDKKLIRDKLNLRLGFVNFIKVHFISALYGNGINDLLSSIHETYQSSIRKIYTALLTRTMKMAEKGHKPPLIQGHSIKMKYAHVGGYNPLVVVIHGNYVTYLPDSYKRYLIKYFHRILHIIGTPIRIQFKESTNC